MSCDDTLWASTASSRYFFKFADANKEDCALDEDEFSPMHHDLSIKGVVIPRLALAWQVRCCLTSGPPHCLT